MTQRHLLLAAVALFFTACNTDSPTSPLVPTDARADAAGPPTIVSKFPATGAIGIWRAGSITAKWNEDMRASTLNTTNFRIKGPDGVVVPAVVTYTSSNRTAKLNPNSTLLPHTVYTVTVTINVKDATGTRKASNQSWSFTTGWSGANGPNRINLGTAGNYAILAKTGISTTGVTAITGKVAVSPAAGTYLTGFSQTMYSTNQYSTSPKVTGRLYAASYASPTPSNLTVAIGDMQTAYTNTAGRVNPDRTELGAGNINGMTLTPGLYKWSSGLNIPIVVTLRGDSNDVFIFQIAGNLTAGNNSVITLSGGVRPENIFWQVAGKVTLGTTSHFQGVILCKTLIAMNTGAALRGRALAQTAVTLQAVRLSEPNF